MRTAGLAVLSACGRLGFATVSGEALDAHGDGLADTASDGQAICHSTSWGVPTLVPGFDSSSHESDPTLTPDGLTMFYTGNAGASMGFAIWTASRATADVEFGMQARVVELDSAGDDADPAISADGLTLLFGSDRLGSGYQLFVAHRATVDSPFDPPVPLTINGASTQVGNSPALTADGLGLYYAFASIELAFATRSSPNDSFQLVRELDEVNAPQTDGTPAITADGLELFFESSRTVPVSAYVARRASTTDPFGPPEPLSQLTADIPGASATGGPEISPDGRTMYIFGNTTSIDIYRVTRTCP